jgi:hypothetical protein
MRESWRGLFHRRFTMATVTHTLVPEGRRLAVTAELFGAWFPTRVEPVVYTFAGRLSKDYRGGCWEFWTLSKSGFYMAPAGDRPLHVICENPFEGDLSADAFEVTVCLYACSHLSFAGPDAFADVCTDHHYRLREFTMEHPQAGAILKATD